MLMDLIKARKSIRKYTNQQITREDLDKIIEAGIYAPNAGGGQKSMVVAIHNKEITTLVGKLNMSDLKQDASLGNFVSKEQPSILDDPTITNGFYDAPSVICIFGDDGFPFSTADAFSMCENMLLQATELGIASCVISRGKETFDNEQGRALKKEWDVPDHYSCEVFIIVGYIDGPWPMSKPRKPGRVKVIE